jgi:hypothetical protein
MKFSEVKLPSNRQFGIFFSGVFFVFSIYFLYLESDLLASTFFIIALLFIIISIVNADLLLPLNKIWMKVGIILGRIISPIIMAAIFFMLITPYSIVMRIMGRDELKLKKMSKTYWIPRFHSLPQTDFKKQF